MQARKWGSGFQDVSRHRVFGMPETNEFAASSRRAAGYHGALLPCRREGKRNLALPCSAFFEEQVCPFEQMALSLRPIAASAPTPAAYRSWSWLRA